MTKASLRAAIEAGTFVMAPGIHDMIAAVVANKVGFDFVYATGYWMTASASACPMPASRRTARCSIASPR